MHSDLASNWYLFPHIDLHLDWCVNLQLFPHRNAWSSDLCQYFTSTIIIPFTSTVFSLLLYFELKLQGPASFWD